MECGMSKYGGSGRKQGDPEADLIGTVRRAPNGEYIAIKWPSPPHAACWAVVDYVGSVGYETSATVAHWPVGGAVPYTPAAGMALLPHPAPPRSARARASLATPPPEDGAECANSSCSHPYAGHDSGLSGARCSERGCVCPRFYVEQRVGDYAVVN
jgi:hypothetical protein